MTAAIPFVFGCFECCRIFDLRDPAQAAEWEYGHDCESDG